MRSAVSVVLLLLVLLLPLVIGDGEELGYQSRRHDYKRSLKRPFMYHGIGDKAGEIPHFEVSGDAIVGTEYLRLVPSVQSMRGAVWSDQAVPYADWQAVITFSITGRGKLGGDGIAMWYTSERLPVGGTAMGSADQFDGLMVFFDTYDNDNRRNNPYVGAVLNDGNRQWNPDTDGMDLAFGGCTAQVKNSAVPVVARITYYHGHLTVDLDVHGKGTSFSRCFTHAGISLPTGYFLGLSAATGGLAGTKSPPLSFSFSFSALASRRAFPGDEC